MATLVLRHVFAELHTWNFVNGRSNKLPCNLSISTVRSDCVFWLLAVLPGENPGHAGRFDSC